MYFNRKSLQNFVCSFGCWEKQDQTKFMIPGYRGFLCLSLSQPLLQPVLLAVEPQPQLFFPNYCNAGNSDKKYGGTHEDVLVTVQGSKSKFNHITMQLSGPRCYISI